MERENEGWLGGPEAEEEAATASQVEFSQEDYTALMEKREEIQSSPEMGLGGKIEDHEPETYHEASSASSGEIIDPDEEIKEEEVLSPSWGPVEKILISILESLVSTGADIGFDNRSGHLRKKFAEVVVGQGPLKRAISALELSPKEECEICTFLQENVQTGNKREELAKDAILKIIFPPCFLR